MSDTMSLDSPSVTSIFDHLWMHQSCGCCCLCMCTFTCWLLFHSLTHSDLFLWAKLKRARKGKKLPAPKLIGTTAHKSFKRICDLVMDGQSMIIGVHGMTGVGKTAIMMNVYNQLRDTQSDQFDQVIWLDRDLTWFIQKKEMKLYENKKRILFFVDCGGLGHNVGIVHLIKPNRENGCKLVYATRSVDDCKMIGCKEDCIVKVELLSEMEALELFWETVGREVDPTPRMTDIAKEVVKECARLPLMIVAVGKKFRRENKFGWAKLLSKIRDFDGGILKILGSDVWPHFLRSEYWQTDELCVLYPKDWKIPTKELIKYMVALDLDRGERTPMLLNSSEILTSVELDFESNNEWGEGVQMQPLYRYYFHMGRYLISKCGLMLEELPEEIEWEPLEQASFMCNNIKTISISPKCPKLRVLFLNKNPDLCTISHHFFVGMTGLRILDLRDNHKMKILPDSISDLIDLRVLRLSRCRSLKQVPSLAKLLHMQMLELDETAIEELPHGIEMLVQLTVLKLHSLSLREAIPSDYLSRLCSLPHLELHL